MKKSKGYTLKIYGDPESVGNAEPAFLGIDPSYSGFAVTIMDSDGSHCSYVAKFEDSGVERLLNVKTFLLDLESKHEFSLYKFRDIAIEGYAFGSQMANMLGELGGITRLFLYEQYGIKPLLVPPTSLKKYATGKGTGVQKNQILLNVYKKWGVEFKDDNAADSYILARIAAQRGTLAYEKEILEKLDDVKFRA